jgi:hypothetical protein
LYTWTDPVSLLNIRVPCAVDTPVFLPVVSVVPIPILVGLMKLLPTLMPPENVETPVAFTLPVKFPLNPPVDVTTPTTEAPAPTVSPPVAVTIPATAIPPFADN